MSTTTTLVTKELFLDALAAFRNACSEGEDFLAPEIVIEYLLEYGVDMSDAHMALAGIHCVIDYDLTVSWYLCPCLSAGLFRRVLYNITETRPSYAGLAETVREY